MLVEITHYGLLARLPKHIVVEKLLTVGKHRRQPKAYETRADVVIGEVSTAKKEIRRQGISLLYLLERDLPCCCCCLLAILPNSSWRFFAERFVKVVFEEWQEGGEGFLQHRKVRACLIDGKWKVPKPFHNLLSFLVICSFCKSMATGLIKDDVTYHCHFVRLIDQSSLTEVLCSLAVPSFPISVLDQTDCIQDVDL